jgi:hypothetical protein
MVEERCSYYRLISNSKGSTVFNSLNTPVDNNYGDYVHWDNIKSVWVVGTTNINIGSNNEQQGQEIHAISIGRLSGHIDQSTNSIAIGEQAGYAYLPEGSVAIGSKAGQTGQMSKVSTGFSVAIGENAGYDNQYKNATAIGYNAGKTYQGTYAIAVGENAGQMQQSENAIAIGYNAGQTGQKSNTVAIGQNAGQYGQNPYTIAIGQNAGQNNQLSNTIILNATSSVLDATVSGTFINPIRGPIGTGSMLSYNTSTKEIIFNGSSQRYKYDIALLAENTENIYKLTPREFKYSLNDERDIGLIAEEANACDNLFAYKDKTGIPEGIQWTAINTYLIKEIQSLRAKRDILREEFIKIKLKQNQ